jgi:aminocarboxymuconate-semialdehyde decarboxylase
LYSCQSSVSAMAEGPRSPQRGKSGRRVVDLHCHMGVPEAAQLAQSHFKPELEPSTKFTTPRSAAINAAMMQDIRGKLTTPAEKIADMDRLGIDLQVLSPAPPQYYYWADGDLGRTTSRLINQKIAETVKAYPTRFAGLCTVPMQVPELAITELRYCVKELGLRGVEISSNVAGEELSDEKFRPFFAAAEELGILVFLHPLGFTHGDRLREYYLGNVIGNPLESTIAVSHLIFGGVLDQFPKLKICIAHGGGYVASYSGRFDHAYRVRPECQCCKRLPSEYLKEFYYDTVVFDADQVAYLIKKYGSDHVVLGTDYPFDMGEPDPVGLVAQIPGLSDEALDDILGKNAAKLLGLQSDEISMPSGS